MASHTTADAVVVVTPVYNLGCPASLKNAIDWFHAEWTATSFYDQLIWWARVLRVALIRHAS